MANFFLRNQSPGFFGHETQTKSRGDIIKQRITVYVCASCWRWHEKRTKDDPKPTECADCGRLELIKFPSKAEARYAGELRLRQHHGLIVNLRFHPVFTALVPALEPFKGGVDMPISYEADGAYEDGKTGLLTTIYDVKPPKWRNKHGKLVERRDDLYNMKRKLFSGLLGIEIQTIRR